MKTTVWFMMAKGDEPEKVIFQGSPSYNEIDEYFEEKCGVIVGFICYLIGYRHGKNSIKKNKQNGRIKNIN